MESVTVRSDRCSLHKVIQDFTFASVVWWHSPVNVGFSNIANLIHLTLYYAAPSYFSPDPKHRSVSLFFKQFTVRSYENTGHTY